MNILYVVLIGNINTFLSFFTDFQALLVEFVVILGKFLKWRETDGKRIIDIIDIILRKDTALKVQVTIKVMIIGTIMRKAEDIKVQVAIAIIDVIEKKD